MLSFGRQAVRDAKLDLRITLEKRYLPDPAIENRAFDAEPVGAELGPLVLACPVFGSG